ncbi:Glucosamine kinase GspK [Piscirickettsia salmonis]|uniref:BadF/BadG/BcrA/BcrD ATPase family protein n=1 Tax=Piscirickettsia salmonis TaxID=1238 RepID=A0A1L6TDH2_PISSA|nr:BadF/BadG/BcrA/BcrD ATPase family protein [Piscirickettsia salmonis]AKP74499.1 ATPase [Piscirickettsia salmonis LF-89 = ATCC VR-1361]ALB23468.1 badF/BadG/BcrA/BcrD ATPase family protein [Piscirickettsia salmonis]ALY03346.1 ATPase [Piscirickettsia salmonis]AMA42912.1 ATPase [Piscirickettsia salmonis]AOS35380.1 ATPase [Piscirickettsia salmonis]
MNKRCYISVDGGGTSTRARVYNDEGGVLGESVQGASNISICVDQAMQALILAINQAKSQAGFAKSDKLPIGIGIAGLEIPKARHSFLEQVSRLGSQVVVQSDAHTACLGGHDGDDGAILILGTGCIGWLIDKEEVQHVGGYGFPLDDRAGGAGIGLAALQVTLRFLDGRESCSYLLERLAEKFDKNIAMLAEFGVSASKTEFARFAPDVFDAFDHSDVYAKQIIEAAVGDIEMMIGRLYQGNNEALPLCLLGGLAHKFKPLLSHAVQERLVEPCGDALWGGYKMIKNYVELGDSTVVGLLGIEHDKI